jgi:hypothetical protein
MDEFFIKRIWAGKEDEKIHRQFIRFSRGEFKKRFAINSVKQPDKIKLSSSFELVNDMIDFVFSLTSKAEVSGIVLIKENIEEIKEKIQLNNLKVKEKISQAEISGELTSEQEKILSEKAYCLLFDVNSEEITLKTKKKLPKPGKSAEQKVDDKFCVIELPGKYWNRVKEEFLFDCPEGKKYKINHTIVVQDIDIPKGEKDFEKLRIMAKRKGKIIRIKEIDNKEERNEKEFLA